MSHRRLAVLGFASLAILFLRQPTSAAQASPRVVAESPMTIVGYDREVADQAGNSVALEGEYEVLRDQDGTEISRVPFGGEPWPAGTVYGDCGSSYLEVYDDEGNLNGAFFTGFDVTAPAFDFSWGVSITADQGRFGFGFEWEDYGPLTPDEEWDAVVPFETGLGLSGAYHIGEVYAGIALLIDGSICTSGLPSDSARVY